MKIRSSLLVLTAGALLSILIFSALVAAFLWKSTLPVTVAAALAMALTAALSILLSWKLAHRISALADLSAPIARGAAASPHPRPGPQMGEATEMARALEQAKRAADRWEALLERTQTARVAAETASLAKDEFLGVVSHELRNPLNSIQLWLEVLRHQSGSPEQLRRAIEFIKRAADTQAKLIDDLLDIARIESGKLSMDTTTVPLGPLVMAALDSVRLAVAAKEIVMDLRLDQAALAVTGDPVRLQQIAANLLSNAVKFTPRGGRVEVSLTTVGSSARLTIGDSGEGIAPDFLPHIFERFRQADTGSSRTAPGLGLGLSIARQLVELHGGRIWAESPGKGMGATFFVELPLAPIVRVLAGRQERAEDQPVPSIERFRVLVVEDEGGAREALGFLLRSAGAHVTTAASVREALEILDEVRFDVLISDIGMPGQDGYDLMRELRQRPAERGGRTPSIALTAYAGSENEQRALAAGYQIHLAKPVRPLTLRQAMASVARRELAADSADG